MANPALQFLVTLFTFLIQGFLLVDFAARKWNPALKRKYGWMIYAPGILAVFFLVACTTPTQPASLKLTPSTTAPFIPTSVPTSTTAEPIRVLFVGNSLTFFNDLPVMFAELARSGGREIEAELSAQAGWSLTDHAHSSATLEEIKQGDWDFVVLQEQSRLPAIPDQRDVNMYPAVRLLEGQISVSGAETILFMTWGYRDGLPEAGYEDYAEMQNQIQASYLEISDEIEAQVAPVGIAWRSAIERDPNLNLWQMDGIHPNLEGSYLAANVFFALLFKESPAGLMYSADLPEETTQFLQTIAGETVLENLEQWNIP